MVRPAAWPCDQISALKPGGSLARPTGIFSSGVAVAGCGLPFKFGFCLLLASSVLSIGLKPGLCCALSMLVPKASPAATTPIANTLGVILLMSDVLPVFGSRELQSITSCLPQAPHTRCDKSHPFCSSETSSEPSGHLQEIGRPAEELVPFWSSSPVMNGSSVALPSFVRAMTTS